MPEFVALAQWLSTPSDIVAEPPTIEEVAIAEEPVVDEDFVVDDDVDTALADARMFRAMLAEAIELRAREVVREIAIEVLSRELRLAPCDLEAVVARACERYHVNETLEIRAHPDDVPALVGFDNVVGDELLRRGDVLLKAACGMVDASLGARLERVLRAMR